jgi:hypothetical protein
VYCLLVYAPTARICSYITWMIRFGNFILTYFRFVCTADVLEHFVLLGCDTVSLENRFPTFRMNTGFINVWNLLPSVANSYLRKTESSDFSWFNHILLWCMNRQRKEWTVNHKNIFRQYLLLSKTCHKRKSIPASISLKSVALHKTTVFPLLD